MNCLSCMVEKNEEFSYQSEFEDSDGILIGVQYVEKIMFIS